MATIRKRGKSFQIRVSAGYDCIGRQIMKTRTWMPEPGMSKRQIEKELNRLTIEFENQIEGGQYVDSKNIRLSEFCNEYLNLTKQTLAPRTWDTYLKVIEQRILPSLGHLKLADIRPLNVQRFIQSLEQAGQFLDRRGKPVKNKRLSSESIRRIAAVLKSIFTRAVKLELMESNPASSTKIDLPKSGQAEVQVFDKELAGAMLQALECEPFKYQVMIHLALVLGCRRGELMALRWEDIDLNKNVISICHSAYKLKGEEIKLKDPKNRTSIRNVAFPGYCSEMLHLLRKEQTEQKLKLGNLWQDGSWLFCKWNGEQMHPDFPTGWFADFLKRHDLPHMKFHALRHTSATILLLVRRLFKAA